MTNKSENLNNYRDIRYLCYAAHNSESEFKKVLEKYKNKAVVFFGEGDSELIQKYEFGLFAGPISDSKIDEILDRTTCFIYYPNDETKLDLEIVKKAQSHNCELDLNELCESKLNKNIISDLPVVSIVMFADGETKNLKESILSASKQTYQNKEIILVDETDDCCYKEFSFNNSNIKYIHKSFGGAPDAKNIGIAASSGEWIITLTVGELLREDAVSNLISASRANNESKIITSFVATVNGVSEIKPPTLVSLSEEQILPNCSMFKKSIWEEIGGFYEGLVAPVENWAFWIAAVRNNVNITIVPEPLLFIKKKYSNSKYNRAVVHSLFPDLFDIPIILESHTDLKLPDEEIKEQLLERISKFPWLTLPWMWLGLIEEALGEEIRAAKSYIRSVKNSGEENWQAMIRLHVISALLGKKADLNGETEIAEERFLASDEFLIAANGLIDEKDTILAPDWPRART